MSPSWVGGAESFSPLPKASHSWRWGVPAALLPPPPRRCPQPSCQLPRLPPAPARRRWMVPGTHVLSPEMGGGPCPAGPQSLVGDSPTALGRAGPPGAEPPRPPRDASLGGRQHWGSDHPHSSPRHPSAGSYPAPAVYILRPPPGGSPTARPGWYLRGSVGLGRSRLGTPRVRACEWRRPRSAAWMVAERRGAVRSRRGPVRMVADRIGADRIGADR